jgi:hexosaminidase
VAEVKLVLDLMALYKLNTFHWHLVDDQGWRIQIKKYPKLTSVGAWRDGIGFGLDSNSATAYDKQGRYGGFYTQAQIKEVVAYAAARHITVVPEIEMPGHSSAALAAYPQFGCPGVKFSVPLKGGVYTGVYCAGNDATFTFLENVLAEVAPLFPGKYLHIGGDEVVKSNWMACAECQARIKAEGLTNMHALQSYFIGRVEKIVNAQGKNLIGWSEIREGGLAQSATLMDWIGGGAESAASGHDVVMTPNKFAYFDHYQSTNKLAAEPKAIGGFLPLKKVYQFEPVPEKLAPEFHAHVLGGQANLWTEYIPNLRQVEYMMFPRIDALAEVDWSPKDARDWNDFKARAALNEKRLDALGVNYRPLSKPD